MCDTLCGPGAGGMVFAKNSDRPVGEVQLAVPFGRRPTAGLHPAHPVPLDRRHRRPRRAAVLPHVAVGGRARRQRVRGGHRERTGGHGARRGAGPARASSAWTWCGSGWSGPAAPTRRSTSCRPPHDARPGRDRRCRAPRGVRLLVPDRRPGAGLRARYVGHRLRGRPVPARHRHQQPAHCGVGLDARLTGPRRRRRLRPLP